MEPRNPPPSKQEVYSIAAAIQRASDQRLAALPCEDGNGIAVCNGDTHLVCRTHRSLNARGHPGSCRSLAQHQRGSATSSQQRRDWRQPQSIIDSKSPGGVS